MRGERGGEDGKDGGEKEEERGGREEGNEEEKSYTGCTQTCTVVSLAQPMIPMYM